MSNDAMLKALVQGPERSPLFWWMYNHHSALTRTWTGKRVNWTHFCNQMAAAGVTDQTGNPPTRMTAVKTWTRVRQQKTREEEARNKKQRARSREPERGANANRPPPVVTTSAPPPSMPYYPPPSSLMPPASDAMHSRPHETLSKEERRAQSRKEIAHLRRLFRSPPGYDPNKIE